MSYRHSYSKEIDLFVKGRISPQDAARQTATASEILRRLESQPGIILADEVGMGKTFVAFAVAISIALSDSQKRPIVVMVPPSLKEKWPRDFSLFVEKCLSAEAKQRIRGAQADNAIEFLKLLDDPADKRCSIIFLTHGAMRRGLDDGWIKLALIQRALYRRKNTEALRRAVYRFAGKLLHMTWVDRKDETVWEDLLTHDTDQWLKILKKHDIDPENDENNSTDDDPIPKHIRDVLGDLKTDSVDSIYDALNNIPHRETKKFDENLAAARSELSNELKQLWARCICSTQYTLPLLILDEAHHLKNAQTKLASLFQDSDAQSDAEEISRGPLNGVFERMIFLTATPFQLGHFELCSVLDRFGDIAWNSESAPHDGKEAFQKKIEELRSQLDRGQESVLLFDTTWGMLKKEHLNGYPDTESWWQAAQTAGTSAEVQEVVNRFTKAKLEMSVAEKMLRPWLIRHIKEKKLTEFPGEIARRVNLSGKAILGEEEGLEQEGISIQGRSLLPFLLAARATACNPEKRPVFAEGLASSYEAFLHTRKRTDKEEHAIDVDDNIEEFSMDKAGNWYLDQLELLLPNRDAVSSMGHPKIAATVKRAVELWSKGEKVLVFCHYIATGRVLRRHISAAIENEIARLGCVKLKCSNEGLAKELGRIGDNFFKDKSRLRMTTDAEIDKILTGYPALADHKIEIMEIVRRYIRTPSFLVRYFPIGKENITEDAIMQAFEARDGSEMTLRKLLNDFFTFLAERCGKQECTAYISALKSIQTGSHTGADVMKTFGPDEVEEDADARLVANVRLVNGQSKEETRRNLMLTFNTPFYPEILIASSVMAEGVDLHLNCRYVIHHDLCWNPSTLEQRTGRVDRIGAKVEKCGKSINVFFPYIAETQDEKMYRVVMDRERWFKVVMGEKYKVDSRTTEKLAERVPLPDSIAEDIAFKLHIPLPKA